MFFRRLSVVLTLLLTLGLFSHCFAGGTTLLLQNVRQYSLVLQDGAKIIVVEGAVRNMTGNPVPYIGVSAVFFDESGAVIGTERQLCGRVFSVEELQQLTLPGVMSRTRMTHYLHDGPPPVIPDSAIPFTVVFAGEEQPHEFSVSAYVLDLGTDR
ncbi:MAG: FxLYD domain-containing protein [Halodesulfovibrio sp.]